jgi:hypothetical protein
MLVVSQIEVVLRRKEEGISGIVEGFRVGISQTNSGNGD